MSTSKSHKRNKIRLMPNPFPPDNIESLLEIACSTAGLAGIVYKTIKLWLNYRKAKKIVIKKGEWELEIQSGMSQREIEKSINQFRTLTQDSDDDFRVKLPAGVDRSIPGDIGQTQMSTPQKGGKR